MASGPSALTRLHGHLHETRLLGSISSALYYDQNTVMPAAGAAWRGEQLALLAAQMHARQSSAAYAELVAAEAGDRLSAALQGADETMRTTVAAAIGDSTSYRRFDFRRVDVAGSGRFVYASAPREARLPL